MANPEGPVSANLTDVQKFQCTRCNGSKFYISAEKQGVGEGTEGTRWFCVQCGYEGILTFTAQGALGNYSD